MPSFKAPWTSRGRQDLLIITSWGWKVCHRCWRLTLALPGPRGNSSGRFGGSLDVFPATSGHRHAGTSLASGRPLRWGYVLQGNARMTLLSPGASVDTYLLGPGDMYFIPKGILTISKTSPTRRFASLFSSTRRHLRTLATRAPCPLFPGESSRQLLAAPRKRYHRFPPILQTS